MRYLIYLRISKKDQDLRTQLDFAIRFIEQRNQGEYEYLVFSDEMTSKKPLHNRSGGKKLLEELRKGDVIIAMRLDRIARKLHEATNLIDLLDKKEAEVLLVEQPGIQNKIMLGLYAGMAEEEVKLLSKRVSEKLQSKKNRNERYSRHLPYGFTLHDTHMVPIKVGHEIVYKKGVMIPVEEEQMIIKRIHELSEIGYGYQKIANVLAEEGHMSRAGKKFPKMSISRILERLKNPSEVALSHKMIGIHAYCQ